MPNNSIGAARHHLESAALLATQAKAEPLERALEPIRKAIEHLTKAESLITTRVAHMRTPASIYSVEKEFSESEA